MDTKKVARMIPYSGGPKRFAFHIRKSRTYGSTSLLIINRFGVWSAVRCRHVKKTRFLRFHELKDDARLTEKRYVSLRKLGVNDDQVTFWRRRLADFYWNTMPIGHRVHAMNYVHQERRHRWILHFVVFPLFVVMLSAIAFLQVGVLMYSRWPLWPRFCFVLLGDVVLYKLGVAAWRDESYYANTVLVRLLDQLARRR